MVSGTPRETAYWAQAESSGHHSVRFTPTSFSLSLTGVLSQIERTSFFQYLPLAWRFIH